MSHFTVLVIGDNPEKQLAPYHEFECTGIDDEYVQEVDQTEEALEGYKKDTTRVYQDAQGGIHKRFDEEGEWVKDFWRIPTPEEEAAIKATNTFGSSGELNGLEWYQTDWKDGRGYSVRIKAIPADMKEVEVPTSTIESFAEYVEGYYGKKVVPFGQKPDYAKEHKYGYCLVNEQGEIVKVIDRTNPNKKWDWYKVGGRWNGFFKLKPGATGVVGEPGLQRMDDNYKHPGRDRADILRKGDIDIEAMRDEAGAGAAERYDKYVRLTAGCPAPFSWEEAQEQSKVDGKVDWGKAREIYHAQPAIKALQADRDACWWDATDFQCTREEYVQTARDGAIATFAVVKDGKWYERGEMGWWACVSNEKERGEWQKQFSDLFDSLPDDTQLTIVDCHI